MTDKIRTFYMYAPTVTVTGQKAARRRSAKPSMAAAARLSKREGVKVELAPDGTVSMMPVGEVSDSQGRQDDTALNDWIAKHAH